MQAKLLDIINRLYEIQLAKLELEALGAKEVSFNLSSLEFNFQFDADLEFLKNRVSWLESINGEPTWIRHVQKANRKVLRGYADLWYSHFVYPLKARFRPPLARSMINIVCPRDKGKILDPFTGSGTTNIEAYLLGLDCVGIDINPFFCDMTDAKIEFYKKDIGNEETAQLFWRKYNPNCLNYEPDVALEFHPILKIIYTYAKYLHFRDPAKAFFKRFSEIKSMQEEFFKNKDRYRFGSSKTIVTTAEEIPYEDGYFDGVVTSPPYSNALDYLKENRAAPEFWKITPEIKRKYEATRKREKWYLMMRSAIAEISRVTKSQGKICFVIGNQREKGEVIPLVDWCIEEFKKNDCKLLHNIVQLISSTGTWNILHDHVLIFQKS